MRSKKMFIPALSAEAREEIEAGGGSAGHYWCNQTLTELGPDGQPTHPQRCQPGRQCFAE